MVMFVGYRSRNELAKRMCTQILAHLTRDRINIFHLMHHVDGFLDALVEASGSGDIVRRKYAWMAIQNISYSKNCLGILGNTPALLDNLCRCCQDVEESYETQVACMVTLRNLCQRSENIKRMFDVHLFMTTVFACLRTRELNKGRPELVLLAQEILNTIVLLVRKFIQRNLPSNESENPDDLGLPSGNHVGWHLFE